MPFTIKLRQSRENYYRVLVNYASIMPITEIPLPKKWQFIKNITTGLIAHNRLALINPLTPKEESKYKKLIKSYWQKYLIQNNTSTMQLEQEFAPTNSEASYSIGLEVLTTKGISCGGIYGVIEQQALYIVGLYLNPCARGNNLGAQLVTMLEEHAKKERCNRVYLYSTSYQALWLYNKLGYAEKHKLEILQPKVETCIKVEKDGTCALTIKAPLMLHSYAYCHKQLLAPPIVAKASI